VRSTICTSLVAPLAGPVLAGPLPEPGCYVRTYSDAHLANHPRQVVHGMRLRYGKDPHNDWNAVALEIVSANQGEAAELGLGGRVFSQWALCWDPAEPGQCQVECDGGRLVLQRSAKDTLRLTTTHLRVESGGGCDGEADILDLAEPGSAETEYRLVRAKDELCRGLFGEED
jgi:hypothetical protein